MLTLILLPGLDGTGILFENLLAELPRSIDARVVRYPSDPNAGYRELEALARAALPAGRPYVLLGESFSGPIAIRLAAQRPAGLLGLILAVSFARNPLPFLTWARPFMNTASTRSIPFSWRLPFILGGQRPPRLLEQIHRAHQITDDASMRRRVREILEVDAAAELEDLDCPILYLRAKSDRLVPRSAGELVRRKARNVVLSEVSGPHMLLQTQPVECARLIRGFCEQRLAAG